MNYYNEMGSDAADWLESLIRRNLIPSGDVDRRSIEDVLPAELKGYTQCHFFAGIGGWSRALQLAGVCPDTQLWTGSCPCQPFSTAGKGKGTADERHLWPAFFWLISQCRPQYVFGEQVAGKAGEQWFDAVQNDLAHQDYACGMSVLAACSIGAPHIRKRLFWVANTDGDPSQRRSGGVSGEEETSSGERVENGPVDYGRCDGGETGGMGHADGEQRREHSFLREGQKEDIEVVGPSETSGFWSGADWLVFRDGKARPTQPGVMPLASGIPDRVVQTKGYGNAIVPQVAAAFIGSALQLTDAA